MVHVREPVLPPRAHTSRGGRPPYRFVELHLLLQVQADDTVVVIDPVTVKMIHLSYNRKQDVSHSPPDSKR